MFSRILLVLVATLSGCTPSYALQVDLLTPVCVMYSGAGTYQTCNQIALSINDDVYYIPKNYQATIGLQATDTRTAAIVHDWFYRKTCDFSRQDTDLIMREMLINSGVGKVRAYLIYYVTRLLGWHAYNEDYCE